MVRNITGCPVAGVTTKSISTYDRSALRGGGFLLRQSRIFRPAAQAQDHDFGMPLPVQCARNQLRGVGRNDQRRPPGFAVRVGGGQSSTPRLSRHLGVFVPPEQAMPLLRAIIDVWRSTTEYRISRVKARLKFMIDDYGPEGFRKLVEARLGRELEPLAELPLARSRQRPHGYQRAAAVGPAITSAFPCTWADEREPDARRWRRSRRSYGGDIRLTRRQNFILTGIPARAPRRDNRAGGREWAFRSTLTGCTRRRSDVSAIRIAITR